MRRGFTHSLGERRALCASLPTLYTQGGIYHREATLPTHTGRHIPQGGYPAPTQGGIYHRVYLPTHPGRHIPQGVYPLYTPREAYTRVYRQLYTHREAYTRVYSSLHTGRHIPGFIPPYMSRYYPFVGGYAFLCLSNTRFTVGCAQ